MILHSPTSAAAPRRGVVLLAVLVVVVLLSLAAYQFSELMMAEYKATDSYVRSAQAKAYADSGVHYLAAALSNPNTLAATLNNNPYNNPGAFLGVVVDPGAKPRMRGKFTVLTLLDPDDPNFGAQGFRPGVSDESGKINLNALLKWDPSGQKAHDILLAMQLPNLTEDVINSILDWLDPDEEERSNGAEDIYYGSLTPSYHAKNGPLDSLDELLLVKGVTPRFLYGNDRNRNGVLDPEENDGSGGLDRGWSAYFTIYSREANVDSQGNPRIYINAKDLETLANNLQNVLSQDMVNFILACRQYGYTTPKAANSSGGGSGTGGSGNAPSSGNSGNNNNSNKTPSPPASGRAGGAGGGGAGAGGAGSGATGSARSLSRTTLTTSRSGGGNRITSLYDLINAQVSIPSTTPGGKATVIQSPLQDQGTLQQQLPIIFDKLTTTKAAELPARINLLTAPPTIMQALPGLSELDVQAILSARPNLSSSTDALDPSYLSPVWLLTQANIDPAKLSALDRFVTTRTQVYRAQVIGYFEDGGPMARYEVVIDTNQGYPRILYQRDLSDLGKAFHLGAPNP